MPASRLLSLGGLFTTLSTTLALTPAGNENYASQARALRSSSQGALRSRSGPLKYEATSVSFSVGEGDDVKDYLSPIGSMYKSHTLASNWGLEGLKGSMMPVTVFNVEGEVTCSTLGGKVASFSSSDDVWDEVSACAKRRGLAADVLVIHAGDHPPDHFFLPRCQRGSRLRYYMGR